MKPGDRQVKHKAERPQYENGAYDRFEHKFLGFETVTVELPCEADETTCPWAIAKYRQEAVAAGSLKQLEIFASNGVRQRLIENGYVVNQTAPPFSPPRVSFETSISLTYLPSFWKT